MKTVALTDLPSKGKRFEDTVKYPELQIGRLSLKEIGLFSTAVTNKNPDSFVAGVQSLLNVPIRYLTVGDFYYVVTYLRCSMNTPLSLDWQCDGFWYHLNDSDDLIKAPDARKMAMDVNTRNIRLVPVSCDQHNTEVFSFDEMIKVQLPDEIPELGEASAFELPSAKIVAEYDRLSKDPTMAQLIPALQWIKHGDTLRDKLSWLQSQGDKDTVLFDEASKLQQKYAHGIGNLLIGTCAKCGTQVRQKFQLSAESFFRNI